MGQPRDQILDAVDAMRRGVGSRRAFLAGPAKLAGAGALALAFGGLPPGRPAAAAGAQFADDVDVLRYLQSLEQAAHALYRGALIRFSSDESSSGDRLLPKYPTLARIRDQERAHLALLTAGIAARGGEPAARAPAYDFGYEDFAGFLRVAAELEAVAVAAYVRAVAAIEEPALRATVAGVLAVEARHAAYVNGRIGASPFPAATDAALSTAEDLAVPGRFATG